MRAGRNEGIPEYEVEQRWMEEREKMIAEKQIERFAETKQTQLVLCTCKIYRNENCHFKIAKKKIAKKWAPAQVEKWVLASSVIQSTSTRSSGGLFDWFVGDSVGSEREYV